MKKGLIELFSGTKSLFIGMKITLGQFFKRSVTVQYPRQSLQMPPRFRGHIELVRDPETGKALCFACKLCERACPSDCITVDGAKLDGAKKKSVTEYVMDFTKCSLCGSCVEACRDGAIRFSREYNLASLSKEEYVMDLFKRLEQEAGGKAESGKQKAENGEKREEKAEIRDSKAEGSPKSEVRSPKSDMPACDASAVSVQSPKVDAKLEVRSPKSEVSVASPAAAPVKTEPVVEAPKPAPVVAVEQPEAAAPLVEPAKGEVK